LEETYRVEDPIVLLGHETRLVGDRSVAAVVTGAGSSLVSVTTGDVVYTPPPGRYVRRVTADLRHVLIGTDEGAGETSHTQIVDLEDGSTVTLDLDSRIANLSQDGALIWDARQPDGNTPLFDTSTGEALATLEALALQVMPDGEHVSLVTDDGDQVFAVLDELLAEEGTAHVSWDGRRLLSRVEGEPMESAEVVPHLWSGHASDGLIRPVAHTGSPDGSWVVTAGRDEPVRVWAADDGRLVTEILVPNETANTKTDFVLEDPDHLTVLVDDGILLTYTLDTDELIELAESRLTRTLTDDECREFLHLDGGCATV
jgi:WD40 repeat protein